MSLPTSLSSRRTMRFVLAFFMVLCCSAVLAGCAGYTPTAEHPNMLGDGTKTLKIKGVDNPTLYANLPYLIRSEVRDEITLRDMAVWKDSGNADYELQIRVTQFTLRRWAGLQDDVNTIFTSTMGMEFILYDGATNSVVWQSGVRNYNENIENYDETAVMEESVQQLIREIIDSMQRQF